MVTVYTNGGSPPGALRDDPPVVEEFRSFLDRALPAFLSVEPDPASFAGRRRWQACLAEGRWVGLSWPEADGGRALPVRHRLACEAEAAAAGAPPLAGILGVNNVGPTIGRWGTPAQRVHLPRILTGAEIWCQGFSEPDAGSDLFSLRCRATPGPGGGWRLTGQKVWTSAATDADWCQVLARTGGGAASGRDGITCFLVPLAGPGVTVRPLRQMTGDAEFGEIAFDDAPLPDGARLGPEGRGWEVATTTLSFERAGTIALASALRDELHRVVTVTAAAARGAAPAPALRQELAACVVDVELLRIVGLRLLAGLEAGRAPGPEHAVLKLGWSHARQRVALLRLRLAGAAGAAWEPDDGAAAQVVWETLRARASTIAGGTTEVLKNVLAERVLGLPKG